MWMTSHKQASHTLAATLTHTHTHMVSVYGITWNTEVNSKQ